MLKLRSWISVAPPCHFRSIGIRSCKYLPRLDRLAGERWGTNENKFISILRRKQVIYSCRMIWESYTSQLSSSCIICNEAGHVHAAYRCAREVVEKVWRPKALQNQRYHDTRLLYFCRKAGVEHSAGNNALPSQWNGMELGGVVRQVSSPQKNTVVLCL